MKRQPPLFLLCLLAGAATGFAAEPAAVGIQVDVQMVSLAPAQALPLLPRLRHPNTFPAAYAQLQALIAADDATLLAWPVLAVATKLRGVSESLENFFYSTDFASSPSQPSFWTSWSPSDLIHWYIYRRHWKIDVPTAFQEEPLGPVMALEAEYRQLDGQITVSGQLNLKTFIEMSSRAIPPGWEEVHARPAFTSLSQQIELTLPNDAQRLVGIFLPKKPAPRVVLFILHARAKPE